jgi:hypothetical protein
MTFGERDVTRSFSSNELKGLERSPMMNRMNRYLPLILLIGLFSLIARSAVCAEEQPWLRLLRDDSLAGWEHGGQASGWRVQKGVLYAEHGAAPLLGGWTAGDFELRFNWTVKDG